MRHYLQRKVKGKLEHFKQNIFIYSVMICGNLFVFVIVSCKCLNSRLVKYIIELKIWRGERYNAVGEK